MTVEELIKKLQKCDKDLPVRVIVAHFSEDDHYHSYHDIDCVRIRTVYRPPRTVTKESLHKNYCVPVAANILLGMEDLA